MKSTPGVQIKDGQLAVDLANVSPCKHCQQPIAWLTSKKTGRKYPVNDEGMRARSGKAVVTRNDFHKCPMRNAKS